MRVAVALALLAAAAAAAPDVSAFAPPRPSSVARVRAPPSTSVVRAPFDAAAAAATSDGGPAFDIQKLAADSEIMDVASFRNNLESPQMMIDRQRRKSDEVDNTAAAVKGVGIGLGIGAVIALSSYVETGDVGTAAGQGVTLGGIIGAILGANAVMGKSVYVMDLPEANNRLKVDFAEGLMARQDVGYVARLSDPAEADSLYGGRYRGTGGVVACIDCQLRNCPESPNDRRYGSLPKHVHIRNVLVDERMRRRGIADMLVEAVEGYAKEVGAELITLAVDNTNDPAMSLYGKRGYVAEDISSPTAQSKYGTWTRGRSMMTKPV